MQRRVKIRKRECRIDNKPIWRILVHIYLINQYEGSSYTFTWIKYISATTYSILPGVGGTFVMYSPLAYNQNTESTLKC